MRRNNISVQNITNYFKSEKFAKSPMFQHNMRTSWSAFQTNLPKIGPQYLKKPNWGSDSFKNSDIDVHWCQS